MLFLFFLLSASADQKEKKLKMGYAKPLTDSYFAKFVENRKNKKEIWAVMLHTPGNKHSDDMYPKFIKASNLADGMFSFGLIDTKKNPLLARKFAVRSVPSLFVFHENGKSEYTGEGDPSDIIDFCSEFLFDYTKDFEESWVPGTPNKVSAVLFTEKEETPNLWVGVSNYYQNNRKVRVGITRNQSLFDKFGVNVAPEIFFFNQTMNYTYKGKIEFRSISRDLNDFISKKLKIAGEIPAEVIESTEFSKHCVGGVHTCILYTKGTDMNGWNRLHEKYAAMQMVWLAGHKELPWKFMKSGNFWIFNPKGDLILKVDNMSDVGPVLERILKGLETWKPVSEYLNEEL